MTALRRILAAPFGALAIIAWLIGVGSAQACYYIQGEGK